MTELETLRVEVQALRHWLKVLFAEFANTNETIFTPAYFREYVQALRNNPPPDGLNPSAYDAMMVKLLPALERAGEEIAAYLEVAGPTPDQ